MIRKIFIASLFLLPGFLTAQKSSVTEWINLFNGKDLTGWKQFNGKAKYEAQNGEIVGTTVSGEPNSFLATEGVYVDFILELEFKVDPSMNSGIQFRSESRPDHKDGRVYEFEIDPSVCCSEIRNKGYLR